MKWTSRRVLVEHLLRKHELILTRAGARLLNGKPRPRSLSQFLCDLPEGLFAVEDRLRPLEADDSLRRLREIKALLSGS